MCFACFTAKIASFEVHVSGEGTLRNGKPDPFRTGFMELLYLLRDKTLLVSPSHVTTDYYLLKYNLIPSAAKGKIANIVNPNIMIASIL